MNMQLQVLPDNDTSVIRGPVIKKTGWSRGQWSGANPPPECFPFSGVPGTNKRDHAAVDEQAALDDLETFAQNWDNKYPKIAKSWRENWANLSTYFKYPQEVRRLIYTTNTIEGFNRQLRKVTKSKSVFPTDDSLLKMLYLAMMDITKKWTGRRQDWSRIHAQLSIYFA